MNKKPIPSSFNESVEIIDITDAISLSGDDLHDFIPGCFKKTVHVKPENYIFYQDAPFPDKMFFLYHPEITAIAREPIPQDSSELCLSPVPGDMLRYVFVGRNQKGGLSWMGLFTPITETERLIQKVDS